jgi:hypothetical protein
MGPIFLTMRVNVSAILCQRRTNNCNDDIKLKPNDHLMVSNTYLDGKGIRILNKVRHRSYQYTLRDTPLCS